MKKKHPNQFAEKRVLVDLYLYKEYSISMIETELGIPRSRINVLFDMFGIKKKSMSEIQSSKVIIDKIKNSCLLNHGVIAGFADVKKRNSTKLEKYGDENYCNKERAKETCMKKYGKKSYLETDECKQSSLLKYGVKDNVFQSEEIKKKSKITKLEKYGDENYCNRDKMKQTIFSLYGVDNVSKCDIIKDKKKQTSLKNYEVEYPMMSNIIKHKIKQTMTKKYGVTCALLLDVCVQRARDKMMELFSCEHGFQNLEIQKKCLSSNFRIKEYQFKSGRITYVMGYEKYMIDILLNEGKDENDILTNSDCPIINWIDSQNKKHKHIPDIFLISENTIIEVKSEYTAQDKFLEPILLKKKFAELSGYIYKIYVIDKKTKSIKYEINGN